MRDVMQVQDKWTKLWMKNREVMGTGTSENGNGDLAVMVLVRRAGLAKEFPKTVDGLPVVVKTISPIFAGPAGAENRRRKKKLEPIPESDANSNDIPESGPGGNPRIRFPRPVPIGVSTSNVQDFCLSGTFGFRASGNGGDKFLVSNYHVWARNGNAQANELILQPSRGDNNCGRVSNDRIGTFADFEPIDFSGGSNVIDAAVVRMDPGAAAAGTPDDGYGFPESEVAQAVVGMQVQKYGRTTGQTTGEIFVVNATVNVDYGSEGIATFRQQIGVRDTNSDFSRGGDSGSLIVTAPGARPVALLFAGGGTSTFGNPISAVLSRFQLTVDGDDEADPKPPDPADAVIGNLVWQDVNRDGIKDDSELGLSGVSVDLYSPGEDGESGGGDDVRLRRTTTDDLGEYEFRDLAAGKYYVRFAVPAGRGLTQADSGESDRLDSDADQKNGRSPVFDLGVSEQNLSIDAGFVQLDDPKTGRIGNRVWFDRNRNGRQNRGEPGLRRRVVKLYSADDDALIATTRTNSRGYYSFRNLSAGRYYLRFFSGSMRFTRARVGSDNRNSDASRRTGRTLKIELLPGQSNHRLDAGLIR